MSLRSQLTVLSISAAIGQKSEHPNRMKLKGILLYLDEPSTRAPNGAEGHRIIVRTAVAKKRLNTLTGMGLNYDPQLTQHNHRRKVGVIDKAWIDGNALWIEATIWKSDFPEAEEDLKRSDLGMSMEISDVSITDESADIWDIKDFCFTGATVLKKTSAAYSATRAIAASWAKGVDMAVTKKKVAAGNKPGQKPTTQTREENVGMISAAAADQIAAGITKRLSPVMERQTAIMGQLAVSFDRLSASVLSASSKKEDDEEDDDEMDNCDVNAKKDDEDEDGDDDGDDDDDDEDDIDSATEVGDVDKGNLEDMGTELDEKTDDDDDDAGHFNEDAKNKGDKTTSENKVGKTVDSSRVKALKAENKQLRAGLAKLSAQVEKLTKGMRAQKRQVKAATDSITRHSEPFSRDVDALLTKSGLDPIQIQASGQQLSIQEVDAMLTNLDSSLPNAKRIEFKLELQKRGVLVQR